MLQTDKTYKLKFAFSVRAPKAIALSLFVTLLASCAHNTDVALAPVSASDKTAQTEQISQISLNSKSTANVDQIGVANSDYRTKQVLKNAEIPQLTVDQLIAYADRCAPNQQIKETSIDCSELSLRVRRVFKTEDRVTAALVTLNRLGRNELSESAEDELARNDKDLSFSAQAIASGALETYQPAQPEQPVVSDELESFLNEIGLGLNAGAIVQSGGG